MGPSEPLLDTRELLDEIEEEMLPWNPRGVEIPAVLTGRPTYRGYPIPYTQFVSEAGAPNFKTADEERREECIDKRLCGVCGNRLGYWIAFVGGAKAVEARLFFEPAMHEECARYSVQVCPYLVQDPAASADKEKDEESADTAVTKTREPLDKICVFVTRSYKVKWRRGRHLLRGSPAIREHWFSMGKAMVHGE